MRVLSRTATEPEERAFQAHVDVCASCRLSRDMRADFELIGAESNDGAKVAAIAARVQGVHHNAKTSAPQRKRRSVAFRVALAALVVGGVATAGMMAGSFSNDSVGSSSNYEEAVHSQSTVPNVMPAQRAPSAESQEPPVVVPPKTEVVERPPVSPAAPDALSGASAATLFREANQARRQGKTALAKNLYQELQRRYPGSSESAISLVSLGGLLLDSGSISAALAQFDRYLALGGEKRLAAEALFGRGRALRALGRKSEEAQSWRRLLKLYPDSPYSGEARRRLALDD